jgi:predicted TIM-barrel fold metal-dependent hydrolase
MREAGIDKTILFSTTVHPETADSLDSFEKEMSVLNKIVSGRRNNIDAKLKSIEEQVRVIKENPNKFIGFGTVPLSAEKAVYHPQC